jgi:hypothetical protein
VDAVVVDDVPVEGICIRADIRRLRRELVLVDQSLEVIESVGVALGLLAGLVLTQV